MGSYRATFKSIKGITYNLVITNPVIVSKELTLDQDPIHIKIASTDTKYPGLRSVEMEIMVLSESPMTELYTEDLMATSVMLSHGSTTDFVGYLETSEWNMPCTPGRINRMQLVAIDALSAYKQKPYYGRELINAKAFIEDIYDEIDHDVRADIRFHGTTAQIWDSYISTDILQPEDTYAEHNSGERWTTYGEVLNQFAIGTATTVMMVGDVINIYDIAEQPVWNSALENSLRSTSVTMKMIGSNRIIEQKITDFVNLSQITMKNPSRQLVAKKVDNQYVNYYTGTPLYWEKGQGQGNPAVMCGVEYAEEPEDLEGRVSNVMLAAPAISIAERMHVIVPSNDSGTTTIKLKAELHQQNYYDQMYPNVPDLWNASPMFTDQQGAMDCLELVIGQETFGNPRIETEDTTASIKMREAVYTFSVPNSALFAAKGIVQIAFTPDPAVPVQGNRVYCRSITYTGKGYDNSEDEYDEEPKAAETWTASGSDFGESRTLGSSYGSRQPYGGRIVSTTTIPDAGEILADYYRTPHPMFVARVDDDGYDPLGKATYNGNVGTINSADWDIRRGWINIEILAD